MWHHLQTGLLHVTERPFVGRLLSKLERIDWQRRDLLRVVTYHRVDEVNHRPELDPATLSALPTEFAQQMRFLAENYRVISMEAALDAFANAAPLPDRAVLITFDDAYRDFAENAWPIMQRFALPATLFVPTAYPDHPARVFWWDRLYQAMVVAPRYEVTSPFIGRLSLRPSDDRHTAFRRLKQRVKTLPHDLAMAEVEQRCADAGPPPSVNHVLSWDNLRRLAKQGLTLAAHTQTHPLLNRVDARRSKAEIDGSFRDLETMVGPTLPVFAYPDGATSDDAEASLRQAGVSLAFTTARGINCVGRNDPLRLLRINIGRRTNLALFRLQLLPWLMALPGGTRLRKETICQA